MVKLSYIIVLDAVNLLHRIRRCVDVGKVALQFRLGPIVGLVAVPKTGPYMVPYSGRLLFDIWALTGTEKWAMSRFISGPESKPRAASDEGFTPAALTALQT